MDNSVPTGPIGGDADASVPVQNYNPVFTADDLARAQAMQGQGPLQNLPAERPPLSVPIAAGSPASQVNLSPQSIQVPQEQPLNEQDFQTAAQAPAQPATAQAPTAQEQYMKTLQGLTGQQKSINNTLADAGVQKAQFDAAKNTEMANQAQAYIAQEQQQAIQRQKETDLQLKSLAGIQQDYNNFLSSPQAKVDPSHFWESRTTGQKVLAVIGLALGAIGAGTDGKNKAADMLTNYINTDIDAQKHNIQLVAQGKLKNYDMSQNMYALMLKKYQNEDQAEAAVRLLKLQQVQYQLNSQASQYSGTQVKQQASLANIQLDRAMADAKLQFAAVAQQQALLKQIAGVNPASLSPVQMAALPKEIREQVEKQQERSVPGYGVAANKEAAQEFQKKRAELEPAITGVSTILGKLKDFNRITDQKKKAEIMTEMKALAGQLRVPFTGPGALTEKEYERLMDTLGDPTSVTSYMPWQVAKLEQVGKKLNRDMNGYAQQYGLPTKNTANIKMGAPK